MGFSANLDTLEVGSLGHIEKEVIATLHAILPNLMRSRISRLLLKLSKIAVARNVPGYSYIPAFTHSTVTVPESRT